MSREDMQMALEALESDPLSHAGLVSRKQAITALRQALKTEQEPVAWISHIPTIKVNGKQLHWTKEQAYKWSSDITPLYAAPKQWVGLTDKEVSDVIDNVLEGGGWLDVARALEAAIKRKNT